MIYLIIGENAYAAERELARIGKEFGATPEHVDVLALTVSQLADIVRAQSLFAIRRLIVCRGLSDNKLVWEKLGEWASEVADDTALVLIETKADKRTKAYKAIAKQAKLTTVEQMGDRDWRQAEAWLDDYAHAHKVKLSRQHIHEMVQRAHVPDAKPGRQLIDQQVMATAVQTLASLPEVDDDAIATVMPQTSHGTVFDILNYALHGERDKVHDLLTQLKRQDEALAVFPSLMSQWVQLVEIALAGEDAAEDLGIHPYVAQKLAQLARNVRRDQLKHITELGARLDADMKRSAIEPWDAVDRFVLALTVGE